MKNRAQVLALSLGERPARQVLGDGVEEADLATIIGRNHSVADAGQCAAKQLALFEKIRSGPSLISEESREQPDKAADGDKPQHCREDRGALCPAVRLVVGPLAIGEQRMLVVLHSGDETSHRVHRGFARAGHHRILGGLEIFLPQLDDAGQLGRLGVNRLVQSGDGLLLLAIIGGQSREPLEPLVDYRRRIMIGLEIFVIAGDDVTALPRFGILHFGEQGLEGAHDFVAAGDFGRVVM